MCYRIELFALIWLIIECNFFVCHCQASSKVVSNIEITDDSQDFFRNTKTNLSRSRIYQREDGGSPSKANARRRRDANDAKMHAHCGSTNHVTEGVVIISADFSAMSAEQINAVKQKMADYSGLSAANISVFQGRGTFYTTGLSDPVFIGTGPGDYTGPSAETTLLKHHVACYQISSNDPKLLKLREDARNGSLSSKLGYPVVSWYVIYGQVVIPTTATVPSR
eukprot:Seg1702.5 transcript_id=Seg1702.5/GoldUCD/mRNA.D3Y31 product=Dystroglycan protein_id=Seg1702.5/GoldUCD/D3Y31